MTYTRWDPASRAGAVMVRSKSSHDVKAVEALSENVSDWARYQNLAGECDTVETSTVEGNYDWRSYIQEETTLAKRREESAKPAPKKAERQTSDPKDAPTVFYA